MKRRAFIGTMLVGLGGIAAGYNKDIGLWVPKPADIVIPDIKPVSGLRFIDALAEQEMSLQEIARECAARLGEDFSRRQQHQTISEVLFQVNKTGSVALQWTPERAETEQIIRLDNGERMVFDADEGRSLVHITDSLTQRQKIDQLFFGMRKRFDNLTDTDVFTPMTRELRPGVPFPQEEVNGVMHDLPIVTATDPETGLSVRVLRWPHQHMAKGRIEWRIGLDVSHGRLRTLDDLSVITGNDDPHRNARLRAIRLEELIDVETRNGEGIIRRV